MLDDTIAAVSTPRGKGGVALLRVSGPDACAICDRVLLTHAGEAMRLAGCEGRRAYRCSILAPDGGGCSGKTSFSPVDDGLVTVFHAPASFTGEDVVEICCHGGILLTETILAGLFAAGARPAEPGEFTRRAYVNGKMGLVGAEALGSLLEATSREQIKLSHAGLAGRLENAVREQYDALCRVMSSIYAVIDFPDEDLAEMTPAEIGEAFDHTASALHRLADTYRTGHAIAEGIPTVLCGRVNAGKSALYNRLVGRDAAIVTDIEGTTRDLLTETVTAGRVTLRLCDTAGLRATDDPVEKIGIERTRAQIEGAELILALFDGSCPLDERDYELISALGARDVPVIALMTKSDLPHRLAETELRAAFAGKAGRDPARILSVSSETGEGLAALNDAIGELFLDGSLSTENDPILANARQYGAILAASASLESAREALASGLPYDLVSESVEGTMRALGEVDGRQVSEDVVAGIFSHFCVGK